jgi:hypothetical protein
MNSKTKKDSIAANILIVEISLAQKFLGIEPLTQEQKELLIEKDPMELIYDAQLISSAVMLRQQREAAESTRQIIAVQELKNAPTKGVKS